MQLIDWLPALSTTALLAVALWLSRKLIETRLTNAVRHEFDTKLETVRADFRQKEELLRADLRSKEADIAALRSGAMTALATRQAALDKRRLEAVDELWAAVVELGPAKALSILVATFKFDAVAEEAKKNPKMRQLFEMIGQNIDPYKFIAVPADKARPFLSPIVWALFSAYRAIAMQGLVKVQIVKSGLDADLLAKDAIAELIKTALPHHQLYVDKVGDKGYHLLLEELERRILDAITDMLAGKEGDTATVQQAADIVRLSDEVMSTMQASQKSVGGATPPP
jgi:hypothetical protein